jgi:hypothetical protein
MRREPLTYTNPERVQVANASQRIVSFCPTAENELGGG